MEPRSPSQNRHPLRHIKIFTTSAKSTWSAFRIASPDYSWQVSLGIFKDRRKTLHSSCWTYVWALHWIPSLKHHQFLSSTHLQMLNYSDCKTVLLLEQNSKSGIFMWLNFHTEHWTDMKTYLCVLTFVEWSQDTWQSHWC